MLERAVGRPAQPAAGRDDAARGLLRPAVALQRLRRAPARLRRGTRPADSGRVRAGDRRSGRAGRARRSSRGCSRSWSPTSRASRARLPLLQYALPSCTSAARAPPSLARPTARSGASPAPWPAAPRRSTPGSTPPAQDAARQLFLRLVTLGEGAEDTRRRVERTELAAMEVDQDALAAAMDGFGSSRLLSFDRDPRSGTGTVEVAHEALLREWGRLRRWIDSAREDVRLHRRLAAAAREWETSGRDGSFLLRGSQLAQFEPLADESRVALTDLERGFVTRAATRAVVSSSASSGRTGGCGSCSPALASCSCSRSPRGSSRSSSDSRRSTRRPWRSRASSARERSPSRESTVAMLLAHEAVNLHRSPQTEGTLLATLLRSPAALGTFTVPTTVRPCCGMTVSPDGGTLAISDNANNVRFVRDEDAPRPRSRAELWLHAARPLHRPRVGGARLRRRRCPPDQRPRLGHVPAEADPGSQPPVSFHPERGPSGPVRRCSERTRAVPRLPRALAERGPGRGLRRPVATAIRQARRVGSGRRAGTRGAALVAGGRRLLIAGDSQLTVLDAATLRRVRAVPLPPGIVVAIRSDGEIAAVGSEAGSISFVDLSTGRVTPGVGGHSGAVVRAAFSPDGRTLVTTADDGSVIVWDTRTAQPLERLSGHAGRALGVAFSADGQALYTSSLDGAVFEWDLGTTRRFGVPFTTIHEVPLYGGDVPPVPPLAVSPNGSEFAVRLGRSRIGVFSVGSARPTRSFDVTFKGVVRTGSGRVVQTARDVNAIAWAPARDEIVAAGSSGQVELWSLHGKPRLRDQPEGLGRPTSSRKRFRRSRSHPTAAS